MAYGPLLGAFVLGLFTAQSDLASDVLEAYVHVIEEEGWPAAAASAAVLGSILLNFRQSHLLYKTMNEEMDRMASVNKDLTKKLLSDPPTSRRKK